MELFWIAAAGAVVAAVLAVSVGQQHKDLALLLTVTASLLICLSAFYFLEPVLQFLRTLEAIGEIQSGALGTLLKITGVGLASEIVGVVCQDSGNSALARGVHLLGTAVILSLSVPVLQTLLELTQSILGEL